MVKRQWDEVEPESRAAWRRWLSERHGSSPGVWVIWRKKGAGPRGITLEDAVLEALCFGWIDSRLRPLDGTRSALLFTPRRPGGTWSRVNKKRIESLLAEGLIAEPGLMAIQAAQRDGSWDALNAVDELRVPDDLAQALAASPDAQANFDALAPSSKKLALAWIGSAKRAQTRARRVSETVRLATEDRTVADRPRRGR